jgi:hypothetical protein
LLIAEVLREFLPLRFGIEVNAMVIDRFGITSKQADIVIYDAHNQPNFLRKVFPVEMVYAIIEVKTSMDSNEATSALENLKSVNVLEFRPSLTPYWQTMTREQNIQHYPPRYFIFSYVPTASRSRHLHAGLIGLTCSEIETRLSIQTPSGH